MKMRRSLKIALWIGLFFFGLIAAIPVIGWWIINDEAATQQLIEQIVAFVPEQLSISRIHGKLRDGIELENVHFHNDTQNIKVNHVKIVWQLSELPDVFKINEIKLHGISADIKKSEEEESEFDPLAKIELPLNVQLDNFLLTDLQVKQEETQIKVEKVQFSAETVQSQLYLHSLTVQGEGVTASAKGQNHLGEGFAFGLNIDWQFQSPEQGQWRGAVSANGDLQAVSFTNRLLAPFTFQQQGRVEKLMTEPQIVTSGEWQKVRWPLTGKTVQIASQTGGFKFSGTAKSYQVELQAHLKQTEKLQAQLQFKGNGTDEKIHIEKLQMLSKIGHLQVNGDVGWKEKTQFDIIANGEHVNPALVMPDLPGDLSFKTKLKGQVLAEKLQLALNIDYLTGKLRNYPLKASGQMNLVNEQLNIKQISVQTGANQLTAQGQLGINEKNAKLDIALTAPQLKGVWPTLSGQLNAKAHLQGQLTNPSVQLNATGKSLHFEQHGVNDLVLNVNYAADDKKPSQIQFKANEISSGTTKIAKVALSGQGTKPQHHFTLQVNSTQGDVDLALNGRWQNEVWQAQLQQLILQQQQAGRWQLKTSPLLKVAKKTSGVDVAITESCFSQAAASICLQGFYPANGYFQGAVHALLPSDLAKPHLPKDVKFDGQLQINARAEKTRAGLNGHYQLALSKNSKIAATLDKQLTTIPINDLTLAGVLHGNQISTDLNLLFAGKNYVRGQLNFDTGTSQALSGQISAGIMDFALIRPFVTDLTELNGNLTANVAIAGTVKKPGLSGNVSLNNSVVGVEKAGIRVENINLKVYSLAAKPEEFVITGGAKSGTGNLIFSGKALLNAEQGHSAQLAITGSEFEVAKLPTAQVAISPKLNCSYSKTKTAVTGQVALAKAQIQMEDLPASAAVPSEDEEIIGEEKPKEKPAAAPPIAMDINIDLGKKTHFSGLGLNTDLVGNVRLTQKAEQFFMHGTVNMEKASYKSYGQDLTVRRGRFVFNGLASNPSIDVEAIRLSKSKAVTAILKVTGDAKNPQTRISSEPSLPETEALAYLITGKPLNQATKSDGNLLANAALSYGAGKVAWIAEKFGIDEFELEQGETMKDSLLALGQYLTPDLYVGAKVGLFNKNTAVTMKYKITEGLNISTEAGQSQRVYLNYDFSHE